MTNSIFDTVVLPRVLLITVLCAFVFIRWRHRRTDHTREAKQHSREKWLTRIVVTCWALPCWLWLATPLARAADLPIPIEVRLLGSGVALCSLLLLSRVHTTLGANFSPWLELRDDHTLILDGPYAYIRHPMYTAGLLLALSFGPISGNWLVGTVPVAGLLPILFLRIPDEEAMLAERFGSQWEQYRARTGALLPRPFARSR